MLKYLDSLLKPGILEIIGLFFELEVQQFLLGLEQLLVHVLIFLLQILVMLLELVNS